MDDQNPMNSAPDMAPIESSIEWAIVELMGHVRMVGRVREVVRFGVPMGCVEVPTGDEFQTTYFSGQSIYRLTPVTEDFARRENAPVVPRPRVLSAPYLDNSGDSDIGDFDDSDPFANE